MRIQALIEQANLVFYSNPWYGDGVIEKLEKIPADLTSKRPPHGLHTINQLVKHMTVWKRYFIERGSGNDDYKIVADSDIEWPSPEAIEPWPDLINSFKSTHKEMLSVLASKTDEWLDEPMPGSAFKFGELFQGVIHHDVYHIGQIGIIFNLLNNQDA